MGLYDVIDPDGLYVCPHCGDRHTNNWQTKALNGTTLRWANDNKDITFDIGDEVGHLIPNAVMDDGRLTNLTARCPEEDELVYADAIIRDGIIQRLANIRTERTNPKQ